MFGLRNLTKITPYISQNVAQRNMSVISAPARNKISTGELVFLGGAMVMVWCAIPCWVLLHLKNYREKN